MQRTGKNNNFNSMFIYFRSLEFGIFSYQLPELNAHLK